MSYDPFDHNFERGMHNRRSMLGDEWVDHSIANATNFNADFQNLITRYAWNEIWGRPGLDPKTRRIIILTSTVALGRWEEFELHVRAALTGDPATRLTPDEIKEVLLQSALYAGVPAGNTAFSRAQHILHEVGDQIGYQLVPQQPANSCHPGIGKEGLSTSSPALHYSVREPRNGKAPRHTVVLAHALGTDLMMWDGLANLLAADCRVIAYDARGHGSSEKADGLYSMADLADDAARLLRELDTGPVVWVGLSMGSMTGQELALSHPDLVRALVLANTTSAYPHVASQAYQQRIVTVRDQGMEAIADPLMERYFQDDFRAKQPATVARFRRRLASTDPLGYSGCCNAVGTANTATRLDQIKVPTLVIAGELDQVTTVSMAQTLANGIKGAQLAVIKDAPHISVTVQPQAFAELVMRFLEGL